MKINTRRILDYIEENGPCTSSQLAKAFHVSSRTIKNYIKAINTERPGFILAAQDGYTLGPSALSSAGSKDLIPQTSNERISYILNELLNLETESYLSLYDLCDALFISYSTLKGELAKAKKKIQDNHLGLETRKDAVRLTGSEADKRKLINTMMAEESSVNFVDYDAIQAKFPDIHILFIRDVYLDCLNQTGYFINDISLINLVLHTAIAIDRIRNDYADVRSCQDQPWISAHVYQIAEKAGKQFENYFKIEYTDAEIYDLALLIMSRSTPVDYSQLDESNVSKYIKAEYISLSQEILKEIDVRYGLQITDEKALNCFALHLQSLFVRTRNNSQNKNPLTLSIKTTCPFFFDAAVHISSLIRKKTGAAITEDEIAYIAIHLGFMIDETKKAENKISAVLYCPRYYDSIQKLIAALNKDFEKEMTLIHVVTSEDQICSLKGVDLIISVLPVKRASVISHVLISLFLTESDKNQIQKKLNEIQAQKQRQAFEQTLRTLCPASLFSFGQSFSSPYQCLSFMCDELTDQGYGNALLLNEIWERETLSSTAFGAFAIPHSPYMQAQKTTISIVIADKAISWNNHQVKLIMMMCFSKQDRGLFQSVYETLSAVLIEPEKVDRLIKYQDYESFIQTLVDFIEG